MDLDKLSEEEKRLLLNELKKEIGSGKRKRKRARKPKEQPPQPTNINGQQWVPVNQIKHKNQFNPDKIKIDHDQKIQDSDRYDWEHRSHERAPSREKYSGLISVRCKKCGKEESVDQQLVQHDGTGIIYYCNRCAMGGS